MSNFILLFFSKFLSHVFDFLREKRYQISLFGISLNTQQLLLQLLQQHFLLFKLINLLSDKIDPILHLILVNICQSNFQFRSQFLLIDRINHYFFGNHLLIIFHFLNLDFGPPYTAIFHCQIYSSFCC